MDDENSIALDALKQMQSVLRQAMVKIPELDKESPDPAMDAGPVEEAPSGDLELDAIEEEISADPEPVAAKTTVLETITPKSAPPPPSSPAPPMKRGPGRPKKVI